MSTNLDELIRAAKLGGRIDLLIEMRAWIESKIKAADAESERMRQRKETYEHDTRTSSDAAH